MQDDYVSVEPLLKWWQGRNVTHQQSGCVCTAGGRCGSVESLAESISQKRPVSRSTLFRRISSRRVTLTEADEWANALGVHPTAIWKDWQRASVIASLSNGTKARSLW